VLGALVAIVLAACGPGLPPPLGDYMIFSDGGGDTGIDTSMTFGPTVAPQDDPTTCAEAATLRSYVGCDYWPTVVANNVWSIFDFAVVVANAGTAPATVTITGPNQTNQTQTVPPNAIEKFYLPWVPALKGPDADACGASVPLSASVVATQSAYHLTSTVPVSVYQFNALEYAPKGGPTGKDWTSCPGNGQCMDMGSPAYGQPIGCFSFTNDSSLLLPSTALTGNYRVTGYPGESDGTGSGAQPVMGSYFAITGTVDGTSVVVQLSQTAQVLAGGVIAATPQGGQIKLMLNAGDVAQVVGALGSAVDLSGSQIAADKPVQVIAGTPCTQVPDGAPACDHLEQSVFPAETLGTQHFVTVPTGPTGFASRHVVRLYGNVDGTTLEYAPNAPEGCPATLAAGQVVDCGIVTFDFEVTGSHEFAVGSFMLGGSIVDPGGGLGDPSESLMVSVEQYRTKYVFLAPDDYVEGYADIVAPLGTDLVLDGITLKLTDEEPIAAGYVVERISLYKEAGAHVLTASAPVGLQVLGYGSYTSYQYPGGLNLKQISAPPPPPPTK
jgi:hypothetical protein